MKTDNKIVKKNKGQVVMVTLIFFIIISLTLISGGTLPTGSQVKNSSDFLKSKQSYIAADVANDNAFYMINKGHEVSVGATLPFSSGDLSDSIAITDSANKKQIITTGNSTSNTRLSEIVLSQNFGLNLKYAIQAGTGGLTMTRGAVNGDVYSNGNISGGENLTISGSTTVAYRDSTNVGKIIGTSSDFNKPLNITGNAWAHEIDFTKVLGTGFCQVKNYLLDSSGNSISCDTSKSSDPTSLNFPITDTNISDWKTAVSNQTDIVSDVDTYTGDIDVGHTGTSTSIKKISGNLTLACDSGNPANFGNLYVTGNINVSNGCLFNVDALHVGGNLSITGDGILNLGEVSFVGGSVALSGSGKIQLDSSLGTNSGYIISGGIMDLSGSGSLNGSDVSGSFLTLITTSSSVSTVNVSSGGSGVVILAPNGEVNLSNGSLGGIVAKTVNIGGGDLTYDSNMANIVFGGVPFGKWHILDWSEVLN